MLIVTNATVVFISLVGARCKIDSDGHRTLSLLVFVRNLFLFEGRFGFGGCSNNLCNNLWVLVLLNLILFLRKRLFRHFLLLEVLVQLYLLVIDAIVIIIVFDYLSSHTGVTSCKHVLRSVGNFPLNLGRISTAGKIAVRKSAWHSHHGILLFLFIQVINRLVIITVAIVERQFIEA